MDEKKRPEGVMDPESADFNADYANRARNRTVMLTPEMTGQMRARLIGPEEGTAQTGSLLTRRIEPAAPASEPGWELPKTASDEGPEGQLARTKVDKVGGSDTWASESPLMEATEETAVSHTQDGTAEEANGFHEYDAPVDPKQTAYAGQRTVEKGRPRPEEVHFANKAPLAGFLVSFDKNPHGEYLELRTGRMIVSCERESKGNFLVINHPSVSPMHAIMRVTQGHSIQVLDQLSESGTKIIKDESGEEIVLSGEKGVLEHGDTVVFGDCSYNVCILKGVRAK